MHADNSAVPISNVQLNDTSYTTIHVLYHNTRPKPQYTSYTTIKGEFAYYAQGTYINRPGYIKGGNKAFQKKKVCKRFRDYGLWLRLNDNEKWQVKRPTPLHLVCYLVESEGTDGSTLSHQGGRCRLRPSVCFLEVVFYYPIYADPFHTAFRSSTTLAKCNTVLDLVTATRSRKPG